MRLLTVLTVILVVLLVSQSGSATNDWKNIYCVRYAHAELPLTIYLRGADQSETIDAPLVWCIATRGSAVVVLDSGYVESELASQFGVEGYIAHDTLFSQLGLKLEDVQHVVLGHLHWDHAGGTRRFPNAEFVVQQRELEFAAGRMPGDEAARMGFTAAEIVDIVKLNWEGRVRLVDGDVKSLLTGLDVFLTPGHTIGTMTTCLETVKGRVCYASDAVYLYHNIEQDVPLGIALDPGQSVESYAKIRQVVGDGTLIPGHDPAIFSRPEDFGFRRISDSIIAIVEE
jgi:glyoxylase-like metal-dependent hydrolase (beta-lactamase superfamily II)